LNHFFVLINSDNIKSVFKQIARNVGPKYSQSDYDSLFHHFLLLLRSNYNFRKKHYLGQLRKKPRGKAQRIRQPPDSLRIRAARRMPGQPTITDSSA
jgi:hypothetical protein